MKPRPAGAKYDRRDPCLSEYRGIRPECHPAADRLHSTTGHKRSDHLGEIVVFRRQVRRTREKKLRRGLELRIFALQIIEDLLDLQKCAAVGLTRDGPAFHLERAPIRIGTQLAASVDQRRMERTRTVDEMRFP